MRSMGLLVPEDAPADVVAEEILSAAMWYLHGGVGQSVYPAAGKA